MRAVIIFVLGLIIGIASPIMAQWTGKVEQPLLVGVAWDQTPSFHPDLEGGVTVLWDALAIRHYSSSGKTSAEPDSFRIGIFPWGSSQGPDGNIWLIRGLADGVPFAKVSRLGQLLSPIPSNLNWRKGANATISATTEGAIAFFADRDSGRIYSQGVTSEGNLMWDSASVIDPRLRVNSAPFLRSMDDGESGSYVWYITYDYEVFASHVSGDGNVWAKPFKVSGYLNGIEPCALRDVTGDLLFLTKESPERVKLIRLFRNGDSLIATNSIPDLSPEAGMVLPGPDNTIMTVSRKDDGFYSLLIDRSGKPVWSASRLLRSLVSDEQFANHTHRLVAIERDYVLLTNELDAGGNPRVVLTKFDSHGELLWSHGSVVFGYPEASPIEPRAFLTVSGDNLFVGWYDMNTSKLWIQAVGSSGNLLATSSVKGASASESSAFVFTGSRPVHVYDLIGRLVLQGHYTSGELFDRCNQLNCGRYIVDTGTPCLWVKL